MNESKVYAYCLHGDINIRLLIPLIVELKVNRARKRRSKKISHSPKELWDIFTTLVYPYPMNVCTINQIFNPKMTTAKIVDKIVVIRLLVSTPITSFFCVK